MEKLVLGIILTFSATAWGKGTPVTYSDLRPRLLLQATADSGAVETHPEITLPKKGPTFDLIPSEYYEAPIKKNNFYRVIISHSYMTPGENIKKSNAVYEVSVQGLDKKLNPIGKTIHLGSKAQPEAIIGNFIQHEDVLSKSVTLQTGRARVRDHVINSLPTKMNNENIPAYSKFEVISITEEYIPFTLAWEYTLKLRHVQTNRIYELAAPGLRRLPIWAHLVAPGNERVIKFSFGELHY